MGGEVLRLLSGQGGFGVRAATRDFTRAPRLPGVRWVQADLTTGVDPASLEGVDAAFFCSPPGFADQHAVLSPWIQAAKQAGVGRVVLMTAQGVDADERIPFRRAELELAATGLRHHVPRPSWFMQNFHTFWGEGVRRTGVLAVPGGDARVGSIDSRDIAAVAAALLTSARGNDSVHVLTGLESLTHGEATDVLSRELGRTITYVDVDPVRFHASLVGAGLPSDYADLLVNLFAAVRSGAAATLTSEVRSILGRDPGTLVRYARDHRQMLQPR